MIWPGVMLTSLEMVCLPRRLPWEQACLPQGERGCPNFWALLIELPFWGSPARAGSAWEEPRHEELHKPHEWNLGEMDVSCNGRPLEGFLQGSDLAGYALEEACSYCLWEVDGQGKNAIAVVLRRTKGLRLV